MKNNNINPFRVVKGKKIPLHQKGDKIESFDKENTSAENYLKRAFPDVKPNEIKGKLEEIKKQAQEELIKEKEVQTKKPVEEVAPTQVVETPKENVIPDFSKLDFNTAFGKAKELSTQGIGQFKWRGGVYGTALNTKQDLGSYDTKYNTNFKNIYTGSGIAGETFAQRKANEEYAKRVAEDRVKGITPQNPASPAKKGYFDNYEQYSTAWDNAKTQEEKAELTRQVRADGWSSGTPIETPKKTSSVNPSISNSVNKPKIKSDSKKEKYIFTDARTWSGKKVNNIKDTFYYEGDYYETTGFNNKGEIIAEKIDKPENSNKSNLVYSSKKYTSDINNNNTEEKPVNYEYDNRTQKTLKEQFINPFQTGKQYFDNRYSKKQGGKLNPFKYADGGGITLPNYNNTWNSSMLQKPIVNNSFDPTRTDFNPVTGLNEVGYGKNNGEMPTVNLDEITITPDKDGITPLPREIDSLKNNTVFNPNITPLVNMNKGVSNPNRFNKASKFIGNQTKGINAFDVINAGNMIKGYMGRNIKPPKRSFEDRQDIIAPAQGMNPFQKQDAINNLQSQANLASVNNRTIDPRLNTASMLGIQQNTNQGLNQLNSQDSQMYQQDQQRMMGQKQNENLRMLQGKQNFDQRIQDENMRNYQMQQQASQQSINQGLNYMQMKNADNQKRKMQERGNNQMLNAQMYSQAVTEMQQRVKVSEDYKSVTSFDGTVHNFNTPQEAIAFADKLRMSPELEKAGMQEAMRRAEGFNNFMNSDFSQGKNKPMRKGGTLEVSTKIVKPSFNNLNPFKAIGNYTSDLMRMSTAFGLKNMGLRYAINTKGKK